MENSGEATSPSLTRRPSRSSLIRCHTFNASTNTTSDLKKIPSTNPNNNNNTCQSTPQLNCSNERDQSAIHREETSSGLATNGTSLTTSTTSLVGLTPTSTGTIDDKNEVCTCSLSFFLFFLLLYHDILLKEEIIR